MEGYGLKYYSRFYNSAGYVNIELHKKAYSGASTSLRCSTANLIYNYNDLFTPCIGSGLEWTVINENENEEWSTLDELLTGFNREWYVSMEYTNTYDSVFIASAWYNQTFGTFVTSGYNITSAIATGEQFAKTTSFEMHRGDYINIDCNLTLNAGTEPFFFLSQDGVLPAESEVTYIFAGNNTLRIYSKFDGIVSLYLYGESGSNFSIAFSAAPSVNVVTTKMFEGFLLIDEQEQEMLYHSSISLKASCQLAQLNELNEIDAFKSDIMNPMIAYVAQIVNATGLQYGCRVNCNVLAEGMANLFHDAMINKRLFCDTDFEYEDLREILEKILKPFNNFVYYFNGHWFVDRLFDSLGARTYIDYDSKDIDGYSYYKNPSTSYVNNVTKINKQDGDFEYVEKTQKCYYEKGVKTIVITQETKSNASFVNEYFDKSSSKNYAVKGESVIGRWYYDSSGTIAYGRDSIEFVGTNYDIYRGVSTKIPIYKDDEVKTFHINFRRRLVLDAEIAAKDSTRYSTVFFSIIEWDHSPNPEQLTYNNETKKWDTDPLDITGGSYMTVTEYKYDEEEEYYYWEFDLDVDISQLDGNGWHILEFRLNRAEYYAGDITYAWYLINHPTYTKIRITQENSTIEDLESTGKTDENYVDKIEDTISLFSNTDYWLTNVILNNHNSYDDLGDYLCNEWYDARTTSSRTLSLQKLYLESLFQQFKKPRRRIEGSIYYKGVLKPFDILTDNNLKRDGTVIDFLIMGYNLDLTTMQYTDLKAIEVVTNTGEIIE